MATEKQEGGEMTHKFMTEDDVNSLIKDSIIKIVICLACFIFGIGLVYYCAKLPLQNFSDIYTQVVVSVCFGLSIVAMIFGVYNL